jgi:hypothetical protein
MLRARRSISALWIPVKQHHLCIARRLAASASNSEVVDAVRSLREGESQTAWPVTKINVVRLISNGLQFFFAAKMPAILILQVFLIIARPSNITALL